MKTLRDLSDTLRASARARAMKQAELKVLAGVSQRTLTNVLSGHADYKVSTLLALADRLGLALLLVPKGAAGVVDAGQTSAPRVTSRVAAALQRVQDLAPPAASSKRPAASGRRGARGRPGDVK